MTNPEPDNGATRDDLVKRLELMETMIAEGRQSTCRHGWIFVLWGLVNLTGMGWQQIQPHSRWVWWVCLGVGLTLNVLGSKLQKRNPGRARSGAGRSLEAVWSMMGVTMVLYVGTVLLTHFGWQYSYLSALLMILGMAHATSAAILRWSLQAVVAGVWWVGGCAVLFLNSYRAVRYIFFAEMCLGMIAFGLYAMWLERRNGGGWVNRNG